MGYPGGMQAQSAQSTGQFAGRPGGPPMQRPAYPPGNAPPQYPYAPGQPGYQQQAAYQQHQQQMYQRQQVGQQMRPYMSPQGAMVTPTHQGGM
uniref:Annexin A7 n=1 Tax=Heterorhabditis bacteriophora TaxID=37862 RepID=A0A1I7XCM8_HETBA